MIRYSLKQLQSMPTLHSGHFDNLKKDTGHTQIWLSRMTIEDGQPYNNQVLIKRLIKGRWETIHEYEAR
jgi:hypothetical protein